MIPDEIRNGIEAKCDIQESKNKGRNKERKEYQNQKRERESLAPREAYELNEHLKNIRRCPKPWPCESRVVRSDLVSVCVKRKVLVHNNNMNI